LGEEKKISISLKGEGGVENAVLTFQKGKKKGNRQWGGKKRARNTDDEKRKGRVGGTEGKGIWMKKYGGGTIKKRRNVQFSQMKLKCVLKWGVDF